MFYLFKPIFDTSFILSRPFFSVKGTDLCKWKHNSRMKFTSPEFFSPGFPNPYCSENITLSTTEILYGYKPESTLFRAFNHYLLIALYYIHLARNKSEDPRLDVFIVLLEIKIQCEREIAMKTTPNAETSGRLCVFLICVVTSVSFFCWCFFFYILCLFYCCMLLGCI